MENDIRLAYSALTNQIRVSFSVEAVHEDKRPPKDLVRRAKAKLDDEQSKGQIEAFALYEGGLQAFWDHLRAGGEEMRARTASYVLAQGFRQIRDASIRFDAVQKQWLLSLPSQVEVLTKAGWYRVQAWALQKIDIQPHEQPLLRSRIIEAYFRALNGEKIKDFSLRSSLIETSNTGSRVIHDKEAQRMLLCLFDGNNLRELNDIKDFTQKVLVHLGRLQEKSPQYVPFKKEMTELLKDLHGSPESFGFGLPLMIPVAYKSATVAAETSRPEKAAVSAAAQANPAATKDKGAAPAAAAKKKATRSADRLVEFEVSEDGMSAHIRWANDEKLKSGHYDTDRSWLEKALAEAGITFGFNSLIDAVLTSLTMGESLMGKLIAQGLAPMAGEQIFLYPLYLSKESVVDDQEEFDIRTAQNKLVVEVGDVICDVRYRDGANGTDVYGRPKTGVPSSVAERIEVGQGVERRNDGRYYALIRGIPRLERHAVSCRDIYLHDGDVNLKSGDIHFDGDVEVRGSIDNGARVFAKGHLIVRGAIGYARVRCGGDLNVTGGLISSQEGIIIAGGGVFAQFIENSRVVAGGSVGVVKSIVNSNIKTGGEIYVRNAKTSGIVGGGTLVATRGVRSFNVGFKDGEKTTLRIGSDWQTEFRMDLMRQREQKLRRFQQEKQTAVEELKRRNGNAANISVIEKRMTRARKLADKLERAYEAMKTKMRWVDDALLIVCGQLDNNVDVTVGGRTIPVNSQMKEVMISGVRFRDQFINSLDYIETFRKNQQRKAS